MSGLLLEVRGLSARRGGALVLRDVTLSVDAGPPYAIVGASGSGKTTLLFCAAGLLPFEAGSVRVRGEELGRLGPRARARLVGLVFQDYQLFPHLTCLENVCLAPRLRGAKNAETDARALLGELGVAELAGRRPHELSGGQRQRIAIARSLILEPALLFLDEPSAALDGQTTDELAALLLRLSARSQVVVVSHDRAFVERCCGRGARLRNGQVEAEGALDVLFR